MPVSVISIDTKKRKQASIKKTGSITRYLDFLACTQYKKGCIIKFNICVKEIIRVKLCFKFTSMT